jgi:hypothetical protein
MKLILTQEVSSLGAPGDVVEVKDGFGRNYLMPRGLAIRWTRGACPAERLDLLLGTAGGDDGQAAGQEVVAGVPALDLDGVTGGTETGDFGGEDQLRRRHDQRAVEV